jgi:hypothetical protein
MTTTTPCQSKGSDCNAYYHIHGELTELYDEYNEKGNNYQRNFNNQQEYKPDQYRKARNVEIRKLTDFTDAYDTIAYLCKCCTCGHNCKPCLTTRHRQHLSTIQLPKTNSYLCQSKLCAANYHLHRKLREFNDAYYETPYQFCPYTSADEQRDITHRGEFRRYLVTIHPHMQLKKTQNYIALYEQLRDNCSCCTCGNKCIPCFTIEITRHHNLLQHRLGKLLEQQKHKATTDKPKCTFVNPTTAQNTDYTTETS